MTVITLNVAKGSLELEANGKSFTAPVTGNEKFSSELTQAIRRGKNPAEALLFLAEMGAKYGHPHFLGQHIGSGEERQLKEFFGRMKD